MGRDTADEDEDEAVDSEDEGPLVLERQARSSQDLVPTHAAVDPAQRHH